MQQIHKKVAYILEKMHTLVLEYFKQGVYSERVNDKVEPVQGNITI